MGKQGRSSISGGCLGGTLGGLIGIVLGGWIAYTVMSAEVELPAPGTPGLPMLVLLQMYVVAIGVPVLLGVCAGGIVGLMSGSLIGSVIFSKLQLQASPRDTIDKTDVEKNSEGRLQWVNGSIYGLIVFGLFWMLISALMLLEGENNAQGIAFMVWGLLGVAFGIMLSRRVSGSRVLGIIFALPGLLVFPYGTLIAPVLVYALCHAETTRYLSGEL